MKHFELDQTTAFEGYTVKIQNDICPIHPRHDNENMDTMLCVKHRNYRLGDKQANSEEIQRKIKELDKSGGVWLPLYLYDHSGITIRTTPFTCPWDSGQFGIIYIDRETLLNEYNCKRVTKKIRERAIEGMQANVKVYDYFMTGNCWGYTIEDSEGKEIASYMSFFGDGFDGSLDEMEECILDEIRHDQQEKAKTKLARVKVFIKNKVPLNMRQELIQSV